MALRWGIVSAGLIASDFATVLRMLPRSEHQVRPLSGTLGLRKLEDLSLGDLSFKAGRSPQTRETHWG